MDNKLEQLTQKLYDEGLAKGREQGEQMVKEAEQKAQAMIKDAERRAAEIIRKAEKQASDLHKNTLTEVALAGREAVAKIKSELAAKIISQTIEKPVAGATIDVEFVKNMLLAVAANWSPDKQPNLVALLPEANKKEFDKTFAGSVKTLLERGIEVGYSADVKSGFRVKEREGGYYIDFSDDSLRGLLSAYLREKVTGILFN